jgi:hypothetical protein
LSKGKLTSSSKADNNHYNKINTIKKKQINKTLPKKKQCALEG